MLTKTFMSSEDNLSSQRRMDSLLPGTGMPKPRKSQLHAYPRRKHIPGATDAFLTHPVCPLAGLLACVQAASISSPLCDLPNI